MLSVVRQLVCKIGAIVIIAPIFAVNANPENYPTASQQSDLILEIQALRKEVAELRNLIEMQAYQLQQVQQQAGIVVEPQQTTQNTQPNYSQYPSAPPSARPVPYNDSVTNGQHPNASQGGQGLPVVDEVQIGGATPVANNQVDLTQAPVIEPSVGTQLPNVGGEVIDAEGLPLVRPNVSTSLSEDVLYQQAFANLKDANHKKAIEQFKIQLQTYPSGEYADDALYWIGESNYVNRSLGESKKNFQILVQQFPSSHRVPDALLKIAMVEKEQGNKSKARDLFKQLIKQHPKSNAAISARNSLAHL